MRKQILYDNSCPASEETVYNLYVYSLVSWIASAIIELKSCRFLMCKIRLGGYDVRKFNKRQICSLTLSLLVSANSCWVMLQYSSAVHKSFKGLTNDQSLLLYYLMAATAQNSRVFLEGMSYSRNDHVAFMTLSHYSILHSLILRRLPSFLSHVHKTGRELQGRFDRKLDWI